MKNFILPIVTILLSVNTIFAQITITQEHAPSIGLVQYQAEADTLISYIGEAGENQEWDFSFLDTVLIDTLTFVSPVGTSNEEDFPESNLAAEIGGAFQYLETTPEAFYALGFAGTASTGEQILATFSPKSKITSFPATYGTSDTDSTSFDIEINSQFGMVRLKSIIQKESQIDGYGKVTTPQDTYKALRQSVQTQTTDSVWLNFLGDWSLVSSTVSNTTEVNYIARESKGTLISISFAEDGHIDGVSHLLNLTPIVDLPIAGFDIDNQGEGLVSFINTSAENPVSYLWDFGDGGTSTAENPTHNYTQNGTYTVCLTATNSAGENMVCKEVEILLTPVAAFDYTVTGNGELTFADQSTNDPTSWSWDFGDGNTSSEQNPIHAFEVSGEYNVCLTSANAAGEDTNCSPITVVIVGIDDPSTSLSLTLFPNPVNEIINLHINSTADTDLEIRIFDLSGKEVFNDSFQKEIKIKVSDWAIGNYFYQIGNAAKTIKKTGTFAVIR